MSIEIDKLHEAAHKDYEERRQLMLHYLEEIKEFVKEKEV